MPNNNAFLDEIVDWNQGPHTRGWYQQFRAGQTGNQQRAAQAQANQQRDMVWQSDQAKKEQVYGPAAAAPPPAAAPAAPYFARPDVPAWKPRETGPWQSIGHQEMPEQTQRWNPMTNQFELDTGGAFNWDTTTGKWGQGTARASTPYQPRPITEALGQPAASANALAGSGGTTPGMAARPQAADPSLVWGQNPTWKGNDGGWRQPEMSQTRKWGQPWNGTGSPYVSYR